MGKKATAEKYKKWLDVVLGDTEQDYEIDNIAALLTIGQCIQELTVEVARLRSTLQVSVSVIPNLKPEHPDKLERGEGCWR